MGVYMGIMGEGKVRDYTFSLPFSLSTPLKYCKKIYAPVPPPLTTLLKDHHDYIMEIQI
jgi:hypothetical protein